MAWPTGTLFKLTQRGSVNDYSLEFKTLANHIIDMPPPFLLSCFISGFSLEIRHEVQALQPLTLIQAATLTHLQEEKFGDFRHTFSGPPCLNNLSNRFHYEFHNRFPHSFCCISQPSNLRYPSNDSHRKR